MPKLSFLGIKKKIKIKELKQDIFHLYGQLGCGQQAWGTRHWPSDAPSANKSLGVELVSMAGEPYGHLCSLDPQALSGQSGAGWQVVRFPIFLTNRWSPGCDVQGELTGNMMENRRLRPIQQLRPARQVPFWQGSQFPISNLALKGQTPASSRARRAGKASYLPLLPKGSSSAETTIPPQQPDRLQKEKTPFYKAAHQGQ